MRLTHVEQTVVDAVRTELFIGGEWRDASDGASFGVVDPSTGEAFTAVADATAEDALAALAAASNKQAAWASTAPRVRSEVLRDAYERINERADDLALLMTLEMGKPLAESRAEVAYAADFFNWFAGEALRIDGRYAVNDKRTGRVIVMRQPVGPCIFITPWNFPMAMGARKIGPAIAAGCTMVVKPANQTPLSMLALAQILEEVGLPGGVLNVVTVESPAAVMEQLIHDPRVRKLSFTGSTAVGKLLARQASDQLLRLSMELGGNAPFLVFEDADLDAAVGGAMVAKMRNIGQACTAANRFHVHESVAAEFAGRLAEDMKALKLGRGTDASVQVGPLIDERQRDQVAELVGDAIARGAKILVGGNRLDGPGYFYEPTVLGDVPNGARMLSEEVFGPVAPIATFATEAEALEQANRTESGLVAYAFTQSLERAFRITEGLETGMVGINQGLVSNAGAPFGGVKQSGFGREGGREGIDEYLETKYAALKL